MNGPAGLHIYQKGLRIHELVRDTDASASFGIRLIWAFQYAGMLHFKTIQDPNERICRLRCISTISVEAGYMHGSICSCSI